MFNFSSIRIETDANEIVVFLTEKNVNHRQSAIQLSKSLAAAFEQNSGREIEGVVIDLSEVSWISSAGLNALICLRGNARHAGAEMRLRSIQEGVRDVFRITRLERLFEMDFLAVGGRETSGTGSAETPVSV